MAWFQIHHIDKIDSPSLVLYKDRVEANVTAMVDLVQGDTSRLMPHVKTHKMPEMIKLQLSRGINRFKASTLAEAEMVAMAGGEFVLIAHQLVGPKISRYFQLVSGYPETHFTILIDDPSVLQLFNSRAIEASMVLDCYIDINSGMNRSGIQEEDQLVALIADFEAVPNLNLAGFHIYDGHIRDKEFSTRRRRIAMEIDKIDTLFNRLSTDYPKLELITGGTPSFTTHAGVTSRICSPGTCVFWDWGYGEKLLEQPFQHAALVVTRVISKPTKGIVTVDLGHKSVSAENPIDKRVKFLNLKDYELLSQSEEHGVIQVKDWDGIKVGDVLYGLPYHICPTVNLYDKATLIENGRIIDTWNVLARKRKITI